MGRGGGGDPLDIDLTNGNTRKLGIFFLSSKQSFFEPYD